MKLKICGMKDNTTEVAQLRPDYLGFIFYEKSPRYCGGISTLHKEIAVMPNSIKKVGVFVNAAVDEIFEKVGSINLQIVQLHGSESADFVEELKEQLSDKVQIWKVFSIKDAFDFSVLREYEPFVDKFLFDTKGKEKGGNGYTFDWSVLRDYPSQKPFILSGGIGINEIEKIREIQKTGLPLYAIDVNSKFETEPGKKDVERLTEFKELMFDV